MLMKIVRNPMMLAFSGMYPGVYDNVMDNGTPGTQYIANVNEPSCKCPHPEQTAPDGPCPPRQFPSPAPLLDCLPLGPRCPSWAQPRLRRAPFGASTASGVARRSSTREGEGCCGGICTVADAQGPPFLHTRLRPALLHFIQSRACNDGYWLTDRSLTDEWSDYSTDMGTQPDDYHITGDYFEPSADAI